MIPINYIGVVLAAISNMVIGYLWYGPLLGKAWNKEMGFADGSMTGAKNKSMAKSYGLMALGALVMAWVLAHAIVFSSSYMNMKGVGAGLMTGFMSWLGFVAPVTIASVLWEGKSWKFWLINNGYFLVALLVMGIIIGLFI
jgi:hypothetical protein